MTRGLAPPNTQPVANTRLSLRSTVAGWPGAWHRRFMRWIVTALALSTPAFAEVPLSADEFEDFVMGRTLSYAAGGVAYGAEEYLSNRRVRWSHLDGECEEGRWYESGGDVCFVYDGIEAPQCWKFFVKEQRLVAQFTNNTASAEVYELDVAKGPLQCMGPEVGV